MSIHKILFQAALIVLSCAATSVSADEDIFDPRCTDVLLERATYPLVEDCTQQWLGQIDVGSPAAAETIQLRAAVLGVHLQTLIDGNRQLAGFKLGQTDEQVMQLVRDGNFQIERQGVQNSYENQVDVAQNGASPRWDTLREVTLSRGTITFFLEFVAWPDGTNRVHKITMNEFNTSIPHSTILAQLEERFGSYTCQLCSEDTIAGMQQWRSENSWSAWLALNDDGPQLKYAFVYSMRPSHLEAREFLHDRAKSVSASAANNNAVSDF